MNIFDAARAYAERTIFLGGEEPEVEQVRSEPPVALPDHNDDPWVGRANLDDDPPFS